MPQIMKTLLRREQLHSHHNLILHNLYYLWDIFLIHVTRSSFHLKDVALTLIEFQVLLWMTCYILLSRDVKTIWRGYHGNDVTASRLWSGWNGNWNVSRRINVLEMILQTVLGFYFLGIGSNSRFEGLTVVLLQTFLIFILFTFLIKWNVVKFIGRCILCLNRSEKTNCFGSAPKIINKSSWGRSVYIRKLLPSISK